MLPKDIEHHLIGILGKAKAAAPELSLSCHLRLCWNCPSDPSFRGQLGGNHNYFLEWPGKHRPVD